MSKHTHSLIITHSIMVIIGMITCYLVLTSCASKLSYEPGSLDDPDVKGASITHTSYKVSERSNVSTANPVIIAVHGYTASSYEWEEFLHYADGYIPETSTYPNDTTPYTPTKNVLVSVVLLGGHGLSLDEFRKATWEDWAKPIIDEYDALVTKGFTNISLAGSSTGGTLILEKLRQNAFSPAPKNVFFIDTLVVPQGKMLHLVPYLYNLISDQQNKDGTAEEKPNWYTTNPKEGMVQLETLINKTKDNLNNTIMLPTNTQCYIYQSKNDPTVDALSAYLLYKGIQESNGTSPSFTAINSDLHVFTRLQGRKETPSDQDKTNQKTVFDEIIDKIIN